MNDLHSECLSSRSAVMSDYEPTSPGGPDLGTRSPSTPGEDLPVTATVAARGYRPRLRRPPSIMRRGLFAAAALVGSATGLFVGIGTSSSASAAQPAAASSSPGHFGSGGQGSNARSGPAAGGSSGTVGNVAKSNFTLTTSAGQEVTVDESSSTKYDKGTSPTSKSAVAKGDHVLVLGTVSSTTIKATQVTVQKSGGGSKPSTAATVVPFQKGAAETSKQVGQIPASYSQGSGTIVSGTTANKATEAALAAYPGGIVDRVVKLSNGEYEVHYIGVNWPHHVFVNQSFKVIGAN
jgi:Domain of unknown function (DUF5666)